MTAPEVAWSELAEDYTNAAASPEVDMYDRGAIEELTKRNALVSLALSAREIVYELRGIREALEARDDDHQ